MKDFRFAAGDFGERLTVRRDTGGECNVVATALSRDLPEKGELPRVIRRMEERGWRHDGGVEAEGGLLEHGEWSTFVYVGPVPDEAKKQAGPNAGLLTLSATGVCKWS